jgi:hypothetical protein
MKDIRQEIAGAFELIAIGAVMLAIAALTIFAGVALDDLVWHFGHNDRAGAAAEWIGRLAALAILLALFQRMARRR